MLLVVSDFVSLDGVAQAPGDSPPAVACGPLELVTTTTSKTGVLVCTYRPVRDTA